MIDEAGRKTVLINHFHIARVHELLNKQPSSLLHERTRAVRFLSKRSTIQNTHRCPFPNNSTREHQVGEPRIQKPDVFASGLYTLLPIVFKYFCFPLLWVVLRLCRWLKLLQVVLRCSTLFLLVQGPSDGFRMFWRVLVFQRAFGCIFGISFCQI